MAHEITDTDGLILHRTAAWHGLGTIVENAPTAAEALALAGLNWDVQESEELAAVFPGNRVAQVTTHKALRRSDTGLVLGVVGADYSVVQNVEMADLAQAVAREGETVRVETAGSIKSGRRVWFLLKGDTYAIGRGDEHVPYLLVTTAHDGTGALRFLPTEVRVVCSNTVSMALANGGGWSWRHTGGLRDRIEDIRTALGSWRSESAKARDAFEHLNRHTLSRDDVSDLWLDAFTASEGPVVMKPTTPGEERRKARAVEALAYMGKVFDSEASRFGGTALVAANAATHWLGHARGRLDGMERVSSNLVGDYAKAKAAVFTRALAMV